MHGKRWTFAHVANSKLITIHCEDTTLIHDEGNIRIYFAGVVAALCAGKAGYRYAHWRADIPRLPVAVPCNFGKGKAVPCNYQIFF